jgi:hypothetical protein
VNDVAVLQWAKTDFISLTVGRWPPDLTDDGVQGFTSHWELRERVGRGDIGLVTKRPELAEADFIKQEWHYVDKELTDLYRQKYGP